MDLASFEWVPQMNMEFETEEAAYNFWRHYGGKMGFNVRRRYSVKSKVDGCLTSSNFVCSNEGKRKKDKRDDKTKKSRAETRTDCMARFQVKRDRETNTYKVVDFFLDHNHCLQKAQARYLLPCQRKIPDVSRCEIDLIDDSEIRPKQALELMSREVGGVENLGYTMIDHKNYLRDKRHRVLNSGVAVEMMKYFHSRVLDNESYKHFQDTNENEEITNIFWADAKMIADYVRFGDVVAFDTTFGTNNEYRPFGVFVGFNNFREIVIFGATLMYDQTTPFEWVFKTFVQAHNHKSPQTIFTDQDLVMGKALENVMPEVKHALCIWHINQNCKKKLGSKEGVLAEFTSFMYEYEKEDEFKKAFGALKEKMGKENGWLDFMYKCKEKWAYCYMKDAVTMGMRTTQLSESINGDLKRYINSNLDMIRFLNHFERVVNDKRTNEIVSEYECTKKLPTIRFNIPISQHAASLYTPKLFEKFQKEVESSMFADISGPVGNEYTVTKCEFADDNHSKKCYNVVWNRDDETVLCECKKFERVGILCWHALKVLDRENIKRIPQHYVLRRWTREVRNEPIKDREGKIIIEDTTLDMTRRKKEMSWHFNPLMAMAAKSEEGTSWVNYTLQAIFKQYNEKFGSPSTMKENVTPSLDDISHDKPRLARKEGQKGFKRKKAVTEKKHNAKKEKLDHISNSQASTCSNLEGVSLRELDLNAPLQEEFT